MNDRHIRPFIWHTCRTVLPLVYDDALSYNDLVNKLMYKVNEVIEKQNEILEMITPEHLTELVESVVTEYFSSEEFKEKLNELVDERVAEDVGDLADRVGTLETNVDGLTTRVGTAESDISGLTSRVGTAESNISGLTSRVGTAESNISGLTSRVGTAESNISGLASRVGAAESEIDGLQANVNYIRSTITSAAVYPIETKVYADDFHSVLHTFQNSCVHFLEIKLKTKVTLTADTSVTVAAFSSGGYAIPDSIKIMGCDINGRAHINDESAVVIHPYDEISADTYITITGAYYSPPTAPSTTYDISFNSDFTVTTVMGKPITSGRGKVHLREEILIKPNGQFTPVVTGASEVENFSGCYLVSGNVTIVRG